VFVAENDMYYIKDVTKPDDIIRLTKTGKKRVIFNGIPDWVYQGTFNPPLMTMIMAIFYLHLLE